MIKKVYYIAKANKIPIQASLERYIKCCISLCGSCAIGRYLICRNGPVFEEKQLMGIEESW
jgi:dihydroorotate dehydrogenase electron transfer subunit